MANGVLVDEATYFNDNETYSGVSGSETNKWVIEDIYDLVQGNSTGSSHSCFRLVSDVDFRDHETYKNGFSNNNLITCSDGIFDGDGHSIKNLVLNSCGNSTFSFKIIKNTDFINLVMINCQYACITVGVGGYMQNCNFGIYVSNCSYTPLQNRHIYDCCFNIKGTLTRGLELDGNPAIRRTHVNLDVIMNSAQVIGGSSSYTLENCYFTGKIKNKANISTVNGICITKFANSYIAVEYDGGSTYNGIKIQGTGFMDTELWCKNGFTGLADNPSSGYIAHTTTAQAQDAEYLNSIGFAVVPTE